MWITDRMCEHFFPIDCPGGSLTSSKSRFISYLPSSWLSSIKFMQRQTLFCRRLQCLGLKDQVCYGR